MRLSAEERRAIRECAAAHFGLTAEVRLFGSRIDDAKRGGDIDLHVVVPDPGRAGLATELSFLADLERRIGERRVDLVVRAADAPRRPIDRIAEGEGLRL